MCTLTVHDMLANAYNNYYWQHHGEGCAWVPDSTFEKYRESYEQLAAAGRTVTRPLSEVPRVQLLVAMNWYFTHTDWSAFCKRDWAAAYATLETTA